MTIPAFHRGLPPPQAQGGRFESDLMPLAQKEELCREILAEFGITSIRERAEDHELIHACLIDPTHRDQSANPTASLNYKKLLFRCLGCGAKGNLVWYIATVRGEDTRDTIQWLRQQTGLAGQVLDITDLMKYIDALYNDKERGTPIPTYSERMLEPWSLIHPYLTDPRDQYGRGIPEETVLRMRVGYAPDYRVSRRPDGSWVTSERIVIPHWWKGDLVGWQTRRLDARDGTAKYLASTDFPKDSTIYNYQPGNRQALVVESAMSVLGHVHAIPEMESTWGAGLSDIQIGLLAKHSKVVHWPDNDKAGWESVEGYDTYWPNSTRVREHHPAVGEKLSRSTDYWVVQSPWDADPGDMTTEDVIGHYEADAVPFSVWRRPERLYCYTCKNVAHEGPCQGGR